MTRQRSLIGMELDCAHRIIEASQMKWLERIFRQSNIPLPTRSLDGQKEEPHFFPQFLLGNLVNLSTIYKTLGLNVNNILLSRETVTSHRPILIGNKITIRTFLKNAYEQQASNNPIGFIILESLGYLEKDLAFYCERVIAVRGGFQRGRS